MLPPCFAKIAFFPDLIQQWAEKFAICNPATPTSSVYILGLIEACTFARQSSLSKCDGPTVRYLSTAPVRLIVWNGILKVWFLLDWTHCKCQHVSLTVWSKESGRWNEEAFSIRVSETEVISPSERMERKDQTIIGGNSEICILLFSSSWALRCRTWSETVGSVRYINTLHGIKMFFGLSTLCSCSGTLQLFAL